MNFEITGVAAITVICYLVGLIVKASPWNNDKYIPIACGVTGGLVGMTWFFMGWAGFPASDPMTALAIGIVSGLAATGVNQAAKQLKQ